VGRHPREGWVEPGVRRNVSRRDFLAGAGGAVGVAGLGGLLGACSTKASVAPGGGSSGGVPLPRPNNPVKWPIAKDDAAIASNLQPETGATLQLYNWVAYVNQQCLDDFAKKYKCKVQLTTFNTMTEAIAKLQTGEIPFDVFFPTVDVIGQLVEGKLIQPLNHSYIPNISQTWSEFTNPFYDQDWQYTVPYTIYTTGIAWRKDKVPGSPADMANPWAFPWQQQYKGKVAVLDDYREGMALAMMKNGQFDLNTTSASDITAAKNSLQDLKSLTNVQIDNNDYTYIPDGRIWIHEAWSGDMAAAPSYMPKGVNVDVVGYWFPTDGKGPVGNDTMTVLKSGKNPVLAHLFLNYLLDLNNALTNISFNGYMQPINGVTPQRLISEQILPPSLTSTVVLESYFKRGVSELELEPAVDSEYQAAWAQFSNGL
jgi:spermidine/putrescine transport system substrate-binding protein